MAIQTLVKTLQHSSQMQSLLAKVQSLQALQEIVNQVLPPEIQPHCCLANFEAGKLVLQVDSSVFAMRLRYVLPSLNTKLRPLIPTLRQIDFFIQPNNDKPRRRDARQIPVSSQAATIIRDFADSMDNTDPLRYALRRLATSLQRPHG